MRTIIAGSRTITDPSEVDAAMAECGWTPTVVICGCARGVDTLGMAWAEARGIPVERYPADWTAHGKAAGPIRNREMARNATALVLVWDGRSSGSRNMLETADGMRLRVFERVVGR